MPTEETYVEADCTIEHEGRRFTAGGAVVTPEHAIGYLEHPVEAGGPLAITSWHGRWLGTARIVRGWRTPLSHVSGEMYQVEATIGGIVYTGRCAGIGMLWNGRRKARQS